MAGIFGVQDFSGARDLSRASQILLRAAQQGFDHPSGTHRFERSAIGFACPPHYSTTKWPLVSREGTSALSVFGEIYLPDGAPLRDNNFEEHFIRPLNESPQQFLPRLDGAFCFALMTDGECLIANDPFGNFALHYSFAPDFFVFASQMEGIRRLQEEERRPRHHDETGVQQYLGLGMTMSGRTMFEGISRLPGGTYLRASKEGIQHVRYYTPRYDPLPRETKQSLENIRKAFESSVIRRTQYPGAAAALTGGFDSRTTWSIILKNRLPITAHTHGLPECNDFRITRRIIKSLLIRQDIQVFDEGFLQAIPDSWQEFTRLTEGGFSIAYAPPLLVWERLSGRFPVMLDSFGGAFYRRQRMKVAERLINPKRDLIPQLLRFERSPLIASGLLRSDARTAIEEAAAMALRAYYDSISETEHLGDKLDRYHFEQVDVMRDSLAGNAQMNFIGLAHPFLSLPAIEAMTRLPIEERRRDAAHKFIVHESFPALERFALDNVGFTAPYRGFSTLRYGPMIVERGLRYVAKIFPKALHGVSLRRPTMDADMILRPGLKELREIVLSSHPQYDRFVNLEKVESAVREFEEHGSQASALVQLVSFRLFLDLFA